MLDAGTSTDTKCLINAKAMLGAIRQYKKDARPRKSDALMLGLGDYPTLQDGNGVTVEVEAGYTDGNYPDWVQMWPQGGVTVTVGKKALVGILKEVVTATKVKTKALGYGYLYPYAVFVPDGGTYRVHLLRDGVACEIMGNVEVTGLPRKFGINAKYLLDAIYGVEGEQVTVRVQDRSGHPLVVGEMAIVMPVHIGR